jgi:hypothetical protein
MRLTGDVTPFDVTRLLLDQDRLAVAGALAAAPMTTDELVAASRRHRKTVLSALGDLRGAGLVSTKDGQYWLEVDTLRSIAQEAAELEIPMDPVIGYGMTDEERAVLGRYFSGRTLIEIPANRAKRQVLLQRLVLEFDVGRRYTEPEVNDILFAFHPDWSTLRRYLVDEGLLDRAHEGGATVYWRSGGRVLDLPVS